MSETFYTVAEVANITGFNRDSIYDAIKTGALGCVRAGRAIKVTQTHLDVWVYGPSGRPVAQKPTSAA